VRIGIDQNFIVSGVPEDRLDDLLAEPLMQAYSPFPGPFERGVVACTGSEFCRFAVVETKERAVKWARTLDAQLSSGENGRDSTGEGLEYRSAAARDAGIIRMHFSGCSASCAQPQIADIGFRGDIAHVEEHIEEAVDIGLGGSLGPDAAFIDWVAGAVPVEKVPQALLRVVSRYRDEHRPDEPFYLWARRTAPEELRSTLVGVAEAVTS
jgi:ferredoxin-nitrite reductase